MGNKSDDKINAIAGIAALSALVAMLLTLSNLGVILPLVSSFIVEITPESLQADEIVQQLAEVRVPLPDTGAGIMIGAIGGFIAISITSTVTAAKIRR